MEALKDFSFWAVVAFILPGFFLVEARSIGARARIAPITKETVSAFVLVTVIYNLCLWYLGYGLQTVSTISTLDRALILKLYVGAPCALGFCYGLAERKFVVQRLLAPFGINAPLPVDNVWQEIFARQPVGTYLVVVLKDGVVYNAMVTDDSRFGSSGDEPDIYLGQLFSLVEWKPADPQRGQEAAFAARAHRYCSVPGLCSPERCLSIGRQHRRRPACRIGSAVQQFARFFSCRTGRQAHMRPPALQISG